MFFMNISFKEQLLVAASVGRENVLALTIIIGMRAFFCSNKNEIYIFFFLKTLLYFK